eukprot:3269732-Rhodomonas_salina.2
MGAYPARMEAVPVEKGGDLSWHTLDDSSAVDSPGARRLLSRTHMPAMGHTEGHAVGLRAFVVVVVVDDDVDDDDDVVVVVVVVIACRGQAHAIESSMGSRAASVRKRARPACAGRRGGALLRAWLPQGRSAW